MKHSFNSRYNRSGATLILTLGILTVLSVLTATFLLTARLHKQTAVTTRNRHAAENALPIALAMAMRQIEESHSYPNYTDERRQFADGNRTYQRLAPLNRWFSETYAKTNNIDANIAFQHGAIMTSPPVEGFPSVNLLTPAALARVPPALTNGLPLGASNPKPLRSGWIPTDLLHELFPDAGINYRLQSKPSQIAFAVFNCSGTLDANVLPQAPTQKKRQRKYFSQSDLSQILEASGSPIRGFMESNNVNIAKIEDREPFFHTSYDPNPNTFRLNLPPANDTLGTERFQFNRPVNLNSPGLYQTITALTSGNLSYNKFNINSITNILRNYESDSADLWQNDSELVSEWLLPTIAITEICRARNKRDQNFVIDNGRRIAWSIANFIDSNRIPETSHFIDYEMPTRSNFAVEDVPLISKISIFNIDDGRGNDDYIGPADKLKNHKYYDMDPNLSNHYAVAVELWYPFAPNSPFGEAKDAPRLDPACYIGVYTNEADISTTTNRAPTGRELANFFGTNIVMKVLFETWAREYENEVGWEYLDGNPIWREIRNTSDYWFTPAMVNNPLWRETTDQGEEWFTVVMTNSPLYKTFYPDTYEILSTNETGVVSTNTFTYMTQTNYWLNISQPGMTNEFIYGQYIENADYMVMYWENSLTGAITNSLLGGVIDQDNNLIELNYTNNIAKTIIYGTAAHENYIISENAETGVINTNIITAMLLSPDTETPQFNTHSNIFNQYSVEQVTPLDMPPEFAQALNEIFLLIPTNSVNAISDFMLLTTEDLVNLKQWDDLFNYFSNSTGIKNTIIPRITEPSLGNLTVNDKHWLDTELSSHLFDPETTTWAKDTKGVNGYFWTVYPKKTTSFLEIKEQIPPGQPPDSEEREIVTNCYALGTHLPGNTIPNTVWVRPVTTVVGTDIMAQIGEEAQSRPFTDRIVDEALMLAKDNDYMNDTVVGWRSVTNVYVADPRDNAYANRWHSFESNWMDAAAESDTDQLAKLHHGVKELPFIHFNGPLRSIGDLGHIYTEYREWKKNESGLTEVPADGAAQNQTPEYAANRITPAEEPADTIDFFDSNIASLLDFFTIKPNKPERGLVQANTTLEPTLDILFSDVMVGWTNNWSKSSETWEKLDPGHNWTTLWREALTNDLHNTGWRGFADMLPDLATNEMHKTDSNISGIANPIEKHNYTEDVLRGLIDKVSFRQNIYVIILAAQTIAPGSSIKNPNVLAEQRVAVTVIRDAYSGNWTVSDWKKLY